MTRPEHKIAYSKIQSYKIDLFASDQRLKGSKIENGCIIKMVLSIKLP